MELTPTLILNLALLIVPPVAIVLVIPAMAGPAHPLDGCLDCSL